MSSGKVLSYPGLIRAYNRIEESSETVNRTETLSIISKLIDKMIQKDLECIRRAGEGISSKVTITREEMSDLLLHLEENNIILYEGVSNKDALIIKIPHNNSNKNRKLEYGKFKIRGKK